VDAEGIAREVADRVRELVTAAEQRAGDIVREAEAEAERIRERGEAEARELVESARRALDEIGGRLRVGNEIQPGPVTVPEPSPPREPEPQPPPETVPAPPAVPEPMPEPMPEPTPPPDEADRPSAGGAQDEAGARLVAMKLALDGASRQEARSRLASEYAVTNVDAIVDDVYAKVAG
jgi:outer membrane biosynthesis protein TonB